MTTQLLHRCTARSVARALVPGEHYHDFHYGNIVFSVMDMQRRCGSLLMARLPRERCSVTAK